jgi:hypothetical protein
MVEISYMYLPMKMEQLECSETLTFKLQMPVNHPEESIQQIFFSYVYIVHEQNTK